MNKIEKQKALIEYVNILMKKYGLKEMIIINIMEDSIMPSFVQDDPIIESSQKEFMREFFIFLMRTLRKENTAGSIHYSDPEEGWHRESFTIKP